MTMPAGAQYLPPVVTRLLGDASDLLQAFAEARAAQAAFAKGSTEMGEKVRSSTAKAGRDVDDFTAQVVRKMHAGESAAAVLKRRLAEVGDEVAHLRKRLASDSANQGLFADFKKASEELSKLRKLAQQIAPDLLDGGRKGGKGFIAGFMEIFSTIGEYMIPILIGVVILASPIIAALIGSAVTVGLGLGFAGAGILLAALFFPKIKAQFIAAGRELKQALIFAISGGFLPAVRSAMLIFRTYIKDFGQQFRQIFDALAPALRPLANALGSGISSFLAAIADGIPQMMPALLTFIDTIPMVMKAVADFLVKITENGPALSRFIEDAAYAIVGFLDGTADVIAWLEGVYLWVVKLNDKFPFIGWANSLKWLKISIKAIGDFFVDLWHKIVDGGSATGDWFADLGASIWGWLKDAGSAVADFVTGVIDWFKALPGKIGDFFAALPGRVAGFVAQMAHRVAYWVGWMVGRWVRFIMDLPGRVLAVIAFVWAWTTRKTNEAVTAIVAEVKALPGQIGRFFSMIWTAVSTWVARTWRSAVLWFQRTKLSIIEHVASAITAAVAFFKGLPARTGTELKKFKDRVVGFFGDAKKWLIDAGKDIVRGIIDGVSGMWNWAVDKIKSLAHDILKGFKDGIDSHSPSKAFAREGENSAIGYVQGWTKAVRKVRDAMSGRSTLDVVMSYPSGGNPRTAPLGPRPGSGDAPLVQAHLYLDGKRFATAVTPATQRRGARNGITGVGAPTTRIV